MQCNSQCREIATIRKLQKRGAKKKEKCLGSEESPRSSGRHNQQKADHNGEEKRNDKRDLDPTGPGRGRSPEIPNKSKAKNNICASNRPSGRKRNGGTRLQKDKQEVRSNEEKKFWSVVDGSSNITK